jgi:hypothetical protein
MKKISLAFLLFTANFLILACPASPDGDAAGDGDGGSPMADGGDNDGDGDGDGDMG